jgi:hypothetical protein
MVTLALGSLTACGQQNDVAQTSESPSICAKYDSTIQRLEEWGAGGQPYLLTKATFVLRYDFGYSVQDTTPTDMASIKLITSEIATVFGPCLSATAIDRLTNGPWKSY